jgi:hypothetical protein
MGWGDERLVVGGDMLTQNSSNKESKLEVRLRSLGRRIDGVRYKRKWAVRVVQRWDNKVDEALL